MRCPVAFIRRRSRRCTFLVIAPLLTAAAQAVSAEDAGAASTTHDLFRLDRLETYLEFEAEYRHAQVDTNARQGLSRSRKQINRESTVNDRAT